MSDDLSGRAFETRQIHAGWVSTPGGTPIFADHGVTGQSLTDLYAPVRTVVEERIASLEGGTAAVAFSSGQSAEAAALLTLARAGDHIVTSSALYGGTYALFARTFRARGIEVSFIEDPDDLQAWRSAVRTSTKAFFAETIGNPRNNVLDIVGVASVAHAAGIPLVVDNTLATPYLLRPFEYGADIVVHSATKYLGGHGTLVAGVVVDGGTFDLGADRTSYSAVLRAGWLRDLGASLAPMNAFLLLRGLETLSLRMERHVANAQAIAAWLVGRREVERVTYPGLRGSPWHRTARRYLPRGSGAVVAFEVCGGAGAGRRFVEALKLFSHVANIGDVRSLVIHPASTTHSQLSAAEQRAAGVTPGLVRLAVGLEGVEDLVVDLDKGFRALAVGSGDDVLHRPEGRSGKLRRDEDRGDGLTADGD
ncbi:MAG: O-acetylhomoserine (thiol)-lyase [Actinomycetota bacterium]|nr:O-acetylhomoserine (thiol)-lyase [Actinomycetota bacterium]